MEETAIEDRPSPDRELALAKRDVMANIGMNLMLFQTVESLMKTMAPMMGAPGEIDFDGVTARQQKLSKMMLGRVTKEFLAKFRLNDASIQGSFRRLIDSRNRLVHHFKDDFGSKLHSVGGCREAIEHLHAQYEVAQAFYAMLMSLAAGLMESVCEGPFRGTPEYDDFRSVCDELLTKAYSVSRG